MAKRPQHISKLLYFILFLVVILISHCWTPPSPETATFFGPFSDVQVPILQTFELPLGITLEFDNLKMGTVGDYNYYQNFLGMKYSDVCQDAPQLMKAFNFSSCSDVFFDHPVPIEETNYHFFLFSTIDNGKNFPLRVTFLRGDENNPTSEDVTFTKEKIPDIVSIFHTYCYYCSYNETERINFFNKLQKIGPETKTSFIGNFKIPDPNSANSNKNYRCGSSAAENEEDPNLGLLKAGKPILIRAAIKKAMNYKKLDKNPPSLPENPWICYCPAFNDFYGDCSQSKYIVDVIFKGIESIYFLGAVLALLFLIVFMVIPCQIISYDECLFRIGYSIAQWRKKLKFQALLPGPSTKIYSFPQYGGYNDPATEDLGSQSQDFVIIETQADFDAQERKKKKKQKEKDKSRRRTLSNVSNNSNNSNNSNSANTTSVNSTSVASSAPGNSTNSAGDKGNLSAAAGNIIGSFWKNMLYHGNEEDYLMNLEESSEAYNNSEISATPRNNNNNDFSARASRKFNKKSNLNNTTTTSYSLYWKLIKKSHQNDIFISFRF